MNDDRLVACLAKYADSQETIQAVRKAIVGLAVAGRLDDRSPSQFADTLDEFIGGLGHPSHTAGPKAKGLESKFESTDLPHPSLTPDRFVSLGVIARIEKGKTGIKQARSGPYPLVVTASDRGSCDHYDFDGAAAIVPLVSSTGHGKASLHRLHYQEGKFALGSILAAVFPKSPELISARFLFEYLLAFKEELLVSQMIGTANVSLTVKKISEVPVPFISRKAQSTVDELMALCDNLEAEREKRDATRDRLTTASLSRLTASHVDEKQFKAHAEFAINVLPELTTRPDQIKVLRQTILDLAVRGKFGRGIKGEWEKVGSYRKLQNGYAFKSSWFSKQGVRLLRNANVGHGTARWEDTVYLPAEHAAEFERFTLHEGDIVLSLDRPFIATGIKVARMSSVDLPALLLQRVGRFVEVRPGLSNEYLFSWLSSPQFSDQINPGRSNGVPHVSSKQIEEAAIFVPSPEDQHRIVVQLSGLKALCGHLEEGLSNIEKGKESLINVLLSKFFPSDYERMPT